jgi:hypothetical protein
MKNFPSLPYQKSPKLKILNILRRLINKFRTNLRKFSKLGFKLLS